MASRINIPGLGEMPIIAINAPDGNFVAPGFGSDDEEPIFLSPLQRRLRERAGGFGYGASISNLLSGLALSGLGRSGAGRLGNINLVDLSGTASTQGLQSAAQGLQDIHNRVSQLLGQRGAQPGASAGLPGAQQQPQQQEQQQRQQGDATMPGLLDSDDYYDDYDDYEDDDVDDDGVEDDPSYLDDEDGDDDDGYADYDEEDDEEDVDEYAAYESDGGYGSPEDEDEFPTSAGEEAEPRGGGSAGEGGAEPPASGGRVGGSDSDGSADSAEQEPLLASHRATQQRNTQHTVTTPSGSGLGVAPADPGSGLPALRVQTSSHAAAAARNFGSAPSPSASGSQPAAHSGEPSPSGASASFGAAALMHAATDAGACAVTAPAVEVAGPSGSEAGPSRGEAQLQAALRPEAAPAHAMRRRGGMAFAWSAARFALNAVLAPLRLLLLLASLSATMAAATSRPPAAGSDAASAATQPASVAAESGAAAVAVAGCDGPAAAPAEREREQQQQREQQGRGEPLHQRQHAGTQAAGRGHGAGPPPPLLLRPPLRVPPARRAPVVVRARASGAHASVAAAAAAASSGASPQQDIPLPVPCANVGVSRPLQPWLSGAGGQSTQTAPSTGPRPAGDSAAAAAAVIEAAVAQNAAGGRQLNSRIQQALMERTRDAAAQPPAVATVSSDNDPQSLGRSGSPSEAEAAAAAASSGTNRQQDSALPVPRAGVFASRPLPPRSPSAGVWSAQAPPSAAWAALFEAAARDSPTSPYATVTRQVDLAARARQVHMLLQQELAARSQAAAAQSAADASAVSGAGAQGQARSGPHGQAAAAASVAPGTASRQQETALPTPLSGVDVSLPLSPGSPSTGVRSTPAAPAAGVRSVGDAAAAAAPAASLPGSTLLQGILARDSNLEVRQQQLARSPAATALSLGASSVHSSTSARGQARSGVHAEAAAIGAAVGLVDQAGNQASHAVMRGDSGNGDPRPSSAADEAGLQTAETGSGDGRVPGENGTEQGVAPTGPLRLDQLVVDAAPASGVGHRPQPAAVTPGPEVIPSDPDQDIARRSALRNDQRHSAASAAQPVGQPGSRGARRRLAWAHGADGADSSSWQAAGHTPALDAGGDADAEASSSSSGSDGEPGSGYQSEAASLFWIQPPLDADLEQLLGLGAFRSPAPAARGLRPGPGTAPGSAAATPVRHALRDGGAASAAAAGGSSAVPGSPAPSRSGAAAAMPVAPMSPAPMGLPRPFGSARALRRPSTPLPGERRDSLQPQQQQQGAGAASQVSAPAPAVPSQGGFGAAVAAAARIRRHRLMTRRVASMEDLGHAGSAAASAEPWAAAEAVHATPLRRPALLVAPRPGAAGLGIGVGTGPWLLPLPTSSPGGGMWDGTDSEEERERRRRSAVADAAGQAAEDGGDEGVAGGAGRRHRQTRDDRWAASRMRQLGGSGLFASRRQQRPPRSLRRAWEDPDAAAEEAISESPSRLWYYYSDGNTDARALTDQTRRGHMGLPSAFPGLMAGRWAGLWERELWGGADVPWDGARPGRAAGSGAIGRVRRGLEETGLAAERLLESRRRPFQRPSRHEGSSGAGSGAGREDQSESDSGVTTPSSLPDLVSDPDPDMPSPVRAERRAYWNEMDERERQRRERRHRRRAAATPAAASAEAAAAATAAAVAVADAAAAQREGSSSADAGGAAGEGNARSQPATTEAAGTSGVPPQYERVRDYLLRESRNAVALQVLALAGSLVTGAATGTQHADSPASEMSLGRRAEVGILHAEPSDLFQLEQSRSARIPEHDGRADAEAAGMPRPVTAAAVAVAASGASDTSAEADEGRGGRLSVPPFHRSGGDDDGGVFGDDPPLPALLQSRSGHSSDDDLSLPALLHSSPGDSSDDDLRRPALLSSPPGDSSDDESLLHAAMPPGHSSHGYREPYTAGGGADARRWRHMPEPRVAVGAVASAAGAAARTAPEVCAAAAAADLSGTGDETDLAAEGESDSEAAAAEEEEEDEQGHESEYDDLYESESEDEGSDANESDGAIDLLLGFASTDPEEEDEEEEGTGDGVKAAGSGHGAGGVACSANGSEGPPALGSSDGEDDSPVEMPGLVSSGSSSGASSLCRVSGRRTGASTRGPAGGLPSQPAGVAPAAVAALIPPFHVQSGAGMATNAVGPWGRSRAAAALDDGMPGLESDSEPDLVDPEHLTFARRRGPTRDGAVAAAAVATRGAASSVDERGQQLSPPAGRQPSRARSGVDGPPSLVSSDGSGSEGPPPLLDEYDSGSDSEGPPPLVGGYNGGNQAPPPPAGEDSVYEDWFQQWFGPDEPVILGSDSDAPPPLESENSDDEYWTDERRPEMQRGAYSATARVLRGASQPPAAAGGPAETSASPSGPQLELGAAAEAVLEALMPALLGAQGSGNGGSSGDGGGGSSAGSTARPNTNGVGLSSAAAPPQQPRIFSTVVQLPSSALSNVPAGSVFSITLQPESAAAAGAGSGAGGRATNASGGTASAGGAVRLQVGNLTAIPTSWRSYLPPEDLRGRHPNDQPGLPGTYDEADIPAWARRFAPQRSPGGAGSRSGGATVPGGACTDAGAPMATGRDAQRARNRRQRGGGVHAGVGPGRQASAHEPLPALWEDFSFGEVSDPEQPSSDSDSIPDLLSPERTQRLFARMGAAHASAGAAEQDTPAAAAVAASAGAAAAAAGAAHAPAPAAAAPEYGADSDTESLPPLIEADWEAVGAAPQPYSRSGAAAAGIAATAVGPAASASQVEADEDTDSLPDLLPPDVLYDFGPPSAPGNAAGVATSVVAAGAGAATGGLSGAAAPPPPPARSLHGQSAAGDEPPPLAGGGTDDGHSHDGSDYDDYDDGEGYEDDDVEDEYEEHYAYESEQERSEGEIGDADGAEVVGVPPLLRSLMPLPPQPSTGPAGQQPPPASGRNATSQREASQQHAGLASPGRRERHSAGPVLEGGAAAAGATQAEDGGVRGQRGTSAPTRVPLPPMPSGAGAAPNAAETAVAGSPPGGAGQAATAGPGTGPGPFPVRRNAVTYPRSQLLAMLQELRSASPGPGGLLPDILDGGSGAAADGTDADVTNWSGRRLAGSAVAAAEGGSAARRTGLDAGAPGGTQGSEQAPAAAAPPPQTPTEVVNMLLSNRIMRGLLSSLPGVASDPPSEVVREMVQWLTPWQRRGFLWQLGLVDDEHGLSTDGSDSGE